MVWAHVHKAAELREPELPMQVVLNVLRDTSEPALGQALGGLIGNDRRRTPFHAGLTAFQDVPLRDPFTSVGYRSCAISGVSTRCSPRYWQEGDRDCHGNAGPKDLPAG